MGADRLIFHCDCNNFYASCECLERPELKNVPMAVAGDPEYRTGVVVAKNELAKKAGVKTTDTVWQARKKCPDIVFVRPRHDFYSEVSARVNSIYHEYTDYLEPASIDESYLDMTGAPKFYGMTPVELADALRKRIREEIGITISVGVSYNKVFAKMGSDYKKPDATTEITRNNYRDILWPLPVSDLLFAGRATVEVLHKKMIKTVGDLAQADRTSLYKLLGKSGEQLWLYANGLDQEKVRQWGDKEEVKSVSRGMTFRRDLVTEQEIHTGLSLLADEVATQLRQQNLKGAVVQVQIKTPALKSYSRQTTLPYHTFLQKEILDTAMQLMRNNWHIGVSMPVRALTVGVTHLLPADQASEQLSLFDLAVGTDGNHTNREKQERLEAAVDLVRQKHGSDMITHGFRDNEEIGVARHKNPQNKSKE